MNTFPRLFLFCLISGLQCLTAQNVNANAAAPAPEVLFICEHGAAKSIIAAAEFNKMAQQRGLPHRAIARGTNPDASFSAPTVSGLRKDGLPEPKGKPQMVTAADVNRADRVVTLGCKLPESVGQPTKMVDWNDVSSPSKNYDAARTDVVRHLEQLIDELSREKPKK
jgi:protein-tyrosine-phosphatase